MSIVPQPSPRDLLAWPDPGDTRLRVLLRRLLQSAVPPGSGAFPDADTPGAELIARLRREAQLQEAMIGSLSELTARTGRAVCVPRIGPPVLLERTERAGWFRLDLGGWAEAPVVRASALQGLFPSRIYYLDERARGSTARAAAGVMLAAILRLMSQVLGLALPISMMLIVDKVVNQGAHNTLLVLLLGVALLTCFQYLFQWTHTLHVARRAELAAFPERVGELRSVLGSGAARELATGAWDCMQGALESGRYAAEVRSQFLADVAFLALLMLLMAAFDVVLLIVALAVLPVCVVIEVWSGRRTRHAAASMARIGQQVSIRYFEATAAAELLQAANLTGHVVRQWQSADLELALTRHDLSLARRLASLTVEGLQKLSVLPVMLLGVSSVMQGGMTLGQYIACSLLAMQLGQPVLRIAAWWRARSDERLRRSAREQLARRCRETAWPASGCGSLPAAEPWLLSVEHLVCMAGAGREPLSFELLSGGWLGIVGRSGCGKSTLLRVLAGIRAPAAGRVLIGGVPVQQLAQEERARFLQLVPQAPILFSASIADNIALADPAASAEDVLAAASVCGVTDFAEQLPEHLNTLVGAAGRPLSGGEQQRVAMARAVLVRPRLLLLDEATAGLDRQGEAHLLARLRRFLPRTSIILVTHRASALRGCRQVLDLDAGVKTAASLRAVAD